MNDKSIWTETAVSSARPYLHGNKDCDVAVIGAGLAGVLIAYKLKEAGLHVIILEAGSIGCGQTKNTTAKITSQHGLKYFALRKKHGENISKLYAKANEEAINDFEKIIKKDNIDCDFERISAYLYSRQNESLLKAEAYSAQKSGINAAFKTKTCLPFSVKGAVEFKNQAQFNPLKFLYSIAKDLEIYESTKVLKVEKNNVITNRGTANARNIVYACHFPITNFPGWYFAKMHQSRSYVIALKNAQTLDGMYYGIDDDGLSFRNYGPLLLLGGSSHRTGENAFGKRYDSLAAYAKKLYPFSEEAARWSAQDCMPFDGIPYIGRFSKSLPNHFVATGFQKWGMTSSMISANIIKALITERKSEYEKVFSPSRFNISYGATLIKEGGHSIRGLTKGAFPFAKLDLNNIPFGHGGIVEISGKKVGVYKNDDGVVYAVKPKCPHLGCQLEWNPDELSWDCPCHGSRFSYMGELLDNPAQINLTKY